jgi:undecaprenyl-phosphate 4-deoxy-4-formamido-L-arabinose transferase
VAFADYMGPDLLLDVLLGWGTTRFCAVDVVHAPRKRGKSNYTATRLFEMGLLALTAYSTKPLRFASWVGFALTGFGVSVLTYVVVLAVFFGSVPGFPFLASLISIFSGAQLFALGLFGEYLTRVFNRALGRPTYVIRETYSALESPDSRQD